MRDVHEILLIDAPVEPTLFNEFDKSHLVECVSKTPPKISKGRVGRSAQRMQPLYAHGKWLLVRTEVAVAPLREIALP